MDAGGKIDYRGCKGCQNRRLGCHSDCQIYAQFKKQVAERNKAINLEAMLLDDVARSIRRNIKRSN